MKEIFNYFILMSIFVFAVGFITIIINGQIQVINKNESEKVPTSCYINESQHMYCINEDGEQVPITLYRSHKHTWDNYGKAKP